MCFRSLVCLSACLPARLEMLDEPAREKDSNRANEKQTLSLPKYPSAMSKWHSDNATSNKIYIKACEQQRRLNERQNEWSRNRKRERGREREKYGSEIDRWIVRQTGEDKWIAERETKNMSDWRLASTLLIVCCQMLYRSSEFGYFFNSTTRKIFQPLKRVM